jgi:hypothetical protein
MKTYYFNLMYALLPMVFAALAFTSSGLLHFDKTEHDFGSIEQGIAQKAAFMITNDSDQPLILKKVKGSCGCTATSYPTEPVPAGSTAEIEATFNAKTPGAFRKTVSVFTNLQEEPFILVIKGTVDPGK